MPGCRPHRWVSTCGPTGDAPTFGPHPADLTVPLVLGVDSSTQATKVELRDADDGTLVGSARAPHPPVSPPRSEQDPRAWWEALVLATAEATADGSRAVAAVSVAAQQHGLVVLGPDGDPLRPAKLWNDTESAVQAAAMVDELGAGAWAARTGSVPRAAFTIAKLAWLAAHEPDVLAAARSVLLPHDYLTYRLTGRRTTDRGDASGTGYFDPVGGFWLPDLLERFVGPGDWPALLPTVLGPTEPVGPLTADGPGGLDTGPVGVVAPGTGDNMAAALGLALPPGGVAVSVGTSGTVYARSTRPAADPSGAVAGFADAAGGYLPLVCTLNATRVTDAVARLLGVPLAGLDALALAADPSSPGPTLLPYFDGERTPDRPTASGTLAGLRGDVTREEVARAAFEGVVCGLLDGLDALASVADVDAGPLVLTGGGARSSGYRRALADLSGRAVLVPRCDEAVATGACVQAAATLLGRSTDEVARSWGLGDGELVRADPRIDAAAVRSAYAELRG
jgi:xylulokinase